MKSPTDLVLSFKNYWYVKDFSFAYLALCWIYACTVSFCFPKKIKED